VNAAEGFIRARLAMDESSLDSDWAYLFHSLSRRIITGDSVLEKIMYEVLRRVLPRDVRRGENISVRLCVCLFVFLFVCSMDEDVALYVV